MFQGFALNQIPGLVYTTFPLLFSLFEDPTNLIIDNSGLDIIANHNRLLTACSVNSSSDEDGSQRSSHAGADVERSLEPTVLDNGLCIVTNKEEQIYFVDKSGYLSGPSLAFTLRNVPVCMKWWIEESRLLDGDSQSDAASVLGYALEAEIKENGEIQKELKKTCASTSIVIDSFTSGISISLPSQFRQQAVETQSPSTLGTQVLDHESICCFLISLFVDDTERTTADLHNVFRYICCHAPTRDWVIRAFLSIVEKSNECHSIANFGEVSTSPKRMTTRSQTRTKCLSANTLLAMVRSSKINRPSWLNMNASAGLGCRPTVFTVHRPPGRCSQRTISINPQVAFFVCSRALDTLISLAKDFPMCFVSDEVTSTQNTSLVQQGTSTSRASPRNSVWDLLINLDSIRASKKQETTSRMPTQHASTSQEIDSVESLPFVQLLRMFESPIVQQSQILAEKLIRLLCITSVGLYGNKCLPSDMVKISSATMSYIGPAINILTSNTFSEVSLQDATGLLFSITVNIPSTRETVFALLLQGTREVAALVGQHIKDLLMELEVPNSIQSQNDDEDDQLVENAAGSMKDIVQNRFTTETVTVPTEVKTGKYFQLPSMKQFIVKTSSQVCLLRIIKVIVLLRRSIYKKKHEHDNQKRDLNINTRGEASPEWSICSSEPRNRDSSEISNESCIDDDDVETSAQVQEKLEECLSPLSKYLDLHDLWDLLSACLTELAQDEDSRVLLALQSAVEAFFVIHTSDADNMSTTTESQNNASASRTSVNVATTSRQVSEEIAAPVLPLLNELTAEQPSFSGSCETRPLGESVLQTSVPVHQQKCLKFAETHRTVINEILRQTITPLLEGPFAVLVKRTRVLDFDIKVKYFHYELECADKGLERDFEVEVRRTRVFEDSFNRLITLTADDWRHDFHIVFQGEEGEDAGGLLREWYMIISREIFNPTHALFIISPDDRVTYSINPSSSCNSNHLLNFRFVGRVIAKAIYEKKYLECYFTRSFYKHILGIEVKYTDMEDEDKAFYQGLSYLVENSVESLGYDLTFSTETQVMGVTEIRDLITNGRNVVVTDENKMDYVRLTCLTRMTGAIQKQLNAFLEGFYGIIPKQLISIFNEEELEHLISGLPNVDFEDLKSNTEYNNYEPNSLQIQWFWQALEEFDQAERTKFLQFVTGTSKVPLQGFRALEGMHGTQKFQIHRDERSTNHLPSAHTCSNQLDLPVYETYAKLRTCLLKAINECSGFGFA